MSKIPFDIKYRPEIESGKYKVIDKNNRPIRIICWDKKSEKKYGYHIVGLVEFGPNHEESTYYTIDGKERLKDKEPGLFLITPEELTQFEREIKQCLAFNYGIEFNDDCNEVLKGTCNSILELAQKELENSDWIKDIREWCYNKGHLEGYAKGQEDAEKRLNEATSFHYGPFPSWLPPCFVGGPCTNPHHDCINCPRHGTSGIAKTDTNIK